MKNKINILLIAGWLACSLGFYSCDEYDPRYSDNDDPIEIKNVHLQNSKDKVRDRTVPFARLGQLIRLDGHGFFGVKEVYINGKSANINPTLMSDNSMIVRVPNDAPTTDAPDNVRNTIVLRKKNLTYKYDFEIRAAAPTITRISHTLPQAGEEITIYGTGLTDLTKIIFPGDVEVTEGITFDERDGKWCKVTVPAGISNDGGSILVLGANGGAYSPAYFNFRRGIVHNFDDVNNQAWSRGAVSGDLSAVIPTSGNGPKSQGKYRSLNTPGRMVEAGITEDAAYFARQNMWNDLLSPLIPGHTPASEVAVQMDIYVQGVWNSGYIRMVIADGWDVNKYCMLYAPWELFGKRITFENPGCWYTVTLPFSDSKDFAESTFADILARVEIAVAAPYYNQWGPWLCNDKYNDIEPQNSEVVIYFDNLRVVPLETPDYSDFEDETEE